MDLGRLTNVMNDGYVSKCALGAAVLWVLVAGLITAAWVVALSVPHHWVVAGMLATTACALSALAAVVHIRLFVGRVIRLIRACNGLESSPSADLRPLR